MKSEGIYKKYTPGLGLISIVAQFQIKSCNTMKKFCALFWLSMENLDNNRIVRTVDKWQPTGKRTRGKQNSDGKMEQYEVDEVRLQRARRRNIQGLAQDRKVWRNFHQMKKRRTVKFVITVLIF